MHGAPYEIYQQYGLTYDKESDRLYYKGSLVGYFEDKALYRYFGHYKDGNIDVYALRDSSGKLIGVEPNSDVSVTDETGNVSQYAIYEKYGLTYNVNENKMYYKNQAVRYFIDRYNNGQGVLSMWAYDLDGTIDLYAVRNNAGLQGELIGIEAYSQEDFNLRTKEIEAEQNNIPDYDVMTFRFKKDEAPDSLRLWIRQCEDNVFDFSATQRNGRYYIYVRGETDFGFSVESDGDKRSMTISRIEGVKGDGYALFSVPLYPKFTVTYNGARKSFLQ